MELMTQLETAKYLRMTPQAFRCAKSRGRNEIPPVKYSITSSGRRDLWDRDEVDAWLEQFKVPKKEKDKNQDE